MSQAALSDVSRTLLVGEGAGLSEALVLAPMVVSRDPAMALVRDVRGGVGIRPADRSYGLALLGGPRAGKTSLLCQTIRADASEPDCAVVALTTKPQDAVLALSAVPGERDVHFLDLNAPEVGFNPLAEGGEIRHVVQAAIHALERSEPLATRDRDDPDRYLWHALQATVGAGRAGVVDTAPTFWHAYRVLLPEEAGFREQLATACAADLDLQETAHFLTRTLPGELEMLPDLTRARLEAARMRLLPVMSEPVDAVLRHPVRISLDEVVSHRRVLIVAGTTGGSDDGASRILMQLLLGALYRTLRHQQGTGDWQRSVRLAVKVDDAHLIMNERLTGLTETLRSGGLELVAAWPRLQSLPSYPGAATAFGLLHRQGVLSTCELADAHAPVATEPREFAAEHFVSRTSTGEITNLPRYHARCSWVSDGEQAPVFIGELIPQRIDESLVSRHFLTQRARGAHPVGRLPDPLPGLGAQQLTEVRRLLAAEPTTAAASGSTLTRTESAPPVARAAGETARAGRALDAASLVSATGGAAGDRRDEGEFARPEHVHPRRGSASTTAASGLLASRSGSRRGGRIPSRTIVTVRTNAALVRAKRLRSRAGEPDEYEETGAEIPTELPNTVSIDRQLGRAADGHRHKALLLAAMGGRSRSRREQRGAREKAHARGTPFVLAFVGLALIVVLVTTVAVIAGVGELEKLAARQSDGNPLNLPLLPYPSLPPEPPGQPAPGPPIEEPAPAPPVLDPVLVAKFGSDQEPSGSPIPAWSDPIFVAAAGALDVNPYLLASVADQESSFGTGSGWSTINPSGCAGFMQLGVGGACGDTWDTTVTLTDQDPGQVIVRNAYRLGVRPSSAGPKSAQFGYDDPFEAVMGAAVWLRHKVGGEPIPSLDGIAYEALCGYYGACADSVADYAPTVLARAQAWQAEGALGEAGDAPQAPALTSLGEAGNAPPAALVAELSRVSAAELARLSSSDLRSGLKVLKLVLSGSSVLPSGIETDAESTTAASPTAAAALAFAEAQIGKPYVFAATGPNAFDCSGLTQAAYRSAGIELPRVAQDQYNDTPHVPPGETLEPGDLVFFGGGPGDVTHVGMVVTAGKPDAVMVDAPHTGVDIRTEPFPTTVGAPWGDDVYVGATRPDAAVVASVA